jgi:aryl-alcohol dehydrogenase-like predicted oxidoreductase
MSRFILGTSQFGSDYGIKQDGQPSLKEIEKIAHIAWDGEIRKIYAYDKYNCNDSVMSIFKDFFIIQKKGVLPDWFKDGSRIGLSVYEIKEIEDEMRIYSYSYDIYQFPINVLDTRFLKYLNPLKELGLEIKPEIHARSIFLQGLLLMDLTELPHKWINNEVYQQIKSFHLACIDHNLELHEAALGWVLGLKDVDYVIVGVNSAEQLKQLLEVKPLRWDYDFSIQDENILNPRKWPKEPDVEFMRKYNSINYG